MGGRSVQRRLPFFYARPAREFAREQVPGAVFCWKINAQIL
jgi:hypothetical protein